MGKSAFALEIANHVAVDEGKPCAFFSLEMSQQEVAQRLMCSRAKVDAHHIRTGKLSKDDWPRLISACGQLEAAPLYVDDTPGLSLLELRARAQTLKRRQPDLGLIVVDYLQLMTTGRSEESRLQDAAVASAEHSLALSTTRYKGGVVTYLEVLTAQNTALSAKLTAIDILRRRLSASVLLVKALGGGWAASGARNDG